MVDILGFTLSYKFFAILVTIWGFCIGLLIQYIRKPQTQSIIDKLQGMEENEKYFVENNQYKTKYGKFYSKYLKAAFDDPNSFFYKMTEKLKINPYDIDRKLKLIKSDLTVEEYISIKVLGFIIGGLISALGIFTSTIALLVGILILFMSIFLEKIVIDDKLKKREEMLEKELPNFLDLLYSAAKSGHTITEAIIKVSSKYVGVCAEEFNYAMVETKGNGGNFKCAMENMIERNNIESLSNVVSDILIAFDKGDDKIVETLQTEADQMRDIVNAKIEEIANKKSSTLIFPMLIFNFAPLFIAILIPMFAQIKAIM